jgi:hypothetical protein
MPNYCASCDGQIAAGAVYCAACLDRYYPEDNPAAPRCPLDEGALYWLDGAECWYCSTCDYAATAATIGRGPAAPLPDAVGGAT